MFRAFSTLFAVNISEIFKVPVRLHENNTHLDRSGAITKAYFDSIILLAKQDQRDIIEYAQKSDESYETVMQALTGIIETLSADGFIKRNEDAVFYARNNMTPLKLLRHYYTKLVLLQGELVGRIDERVSLIENYIFGDIIACAPMPRDAVRLAIEYYLPVDYASVSLREAETLVSALSIVSDEEDLLDFICNKALAVQGTPNIYGHYVNFFEKFFVEMINVIVAFLKIKKQPESTIIKFIDIVLNRIVLRLERAGLAAARGQIQHYYVNFIEKLLCEVKEECSVEIYHLFLRQYYVATKYFSWYRHWHERLDDKVADASLSERNAAIFNLIHEAKMFENSDPLQWDWRLRNCLARFLGQDGWQADFDIYIVEIDRLLKKAAGDGFAIHILELLREHNVFELAKRRMNDLWCHYTKQEHGEISQLDGSFKVTDLFVGRYKTVTLNLSFVSCVAIAYHGEPSLAVFYELVSLAHSYNKHAAFGPQLPVDQLIRTLQRIDLVIGHCVVANKVSVREQLEDLITDTLYNECVDSFNQLVSTDLLDFNFIQLLTTVMIVFQDGKFPEASQKISELCNKVKEAHQNKMAESAQHKKIAGDSQQKLAANGCNTNGNGVNGCSAMGNGANDHRSAMANVFSELYSAVPRVEKNGKRIIFSRKTQGSDGSLSSTNFHEKSPDPERRARSGSKNSP